MISYLKTWYLKACLSNESEEIMEIDVLAFRNGAVALIISKNRQ